MRRGEKMERGGGTHVLGSGADLWGDGGAYKLV